MITIIIAPITLSKANSNNPSNIARIIAIAKLSTLSFLSNLVIKHH